MKLYDRQTGQAREFSPQEAVAAFTSGKFGPKKGQAVPIVAEDGTVGTVEGKDLQTALTNGASLTGEEELHHAQLEARYGGLGGTVAAGAAGAARGLTLGLSDIALGGLGGDAMKERLTAYKELHPAASIGGEVVGAIAPTLLSGGGAAPLEAANLARAGAEGASLVRAGAEAAEVAKAAAAAREATTLARAGEGASSALRTVGALPRGVASAGDAVEHLAMRMLGGEGTTTSIRTAQKALAMGARGLTEGAAYGAANEISETALGDHELTAEKLFAAIGHGALYGAGGGAVMGAAGEVASSALRGAAKGLSPVLEKAADEQAWRALSPLKKFTKEAEARAGGVGAVGRVLREEGVIAMGDTVETILPKITAAKDKAVTRLGEIVDKSGTSVPATSVTDTLERVIAPLRKKAGFEGVVGSLEDYRGSLLRHLGITDETGALTGKADVGIKDLVEQRKALDALAYQEAKSLDPKLRVAFLRDIRSGVEKLESSTIDSAETALTGAERGEYKLLKSRVQKLILAEDAASDTTSRMVTNNALSLGDKIAGGAGIIAGASFGGPMGAVKGAALAMGSKYIREHGNATAAAVLGKLADLGAMRETAARVDRRIADSTDAFFAKDGAKRRVRIHKVSDDESPREEYRARMKQVADAQSAPYRAAAIIGPVMNHAPKTAGSFADTVTRATSFLSTKLPDEHRGSGSIQPQFSPPRLSDAEVSRFLRYARAVDDPTTVLDDMARGQLTRDQVEAVKTVYPKLYDQIRSHVLEKVTDTDVPLTYQKKVQLGVLLDLPTDSSLKPAFVRSMQSNYSQKPTGEKGGSGAPPARPLKDMSKGVETTAQRVEGM